MRFAPVVVLVLAFLVACGGASTPPPAAPCAATPAPAGPAAPAEDAELAARLGADQYGMHRYVIAFLEAGPNRGQSEEEAQALQKAHLANIERMAAEGVLVLAGPFLDDGPVRGIYVFKVDTVEEARALTATDPAIQAGRLQMELHPWYGSAALQELNAIHKRLQAKGITEP